MRILVVEDEKKVAGFVKKGLEEESYAVDVAYDGEEAINLLKTYPYDLVILDLMLPKKDGFQVLKEFRESGGDAPVLILTARDSVEDVVKGLDLGADDYLRKPFSFLELLARVRALLRRRKGEPQSVLRVGDLEVNLTDRRVFRGGKEIELTSREFALLEFLVRNKGRVLTRTMIAEHVWNQSFDSGSNVIDVYINYLRKKIDHGFDKKLIKTIRGVGYMIKDD